jgi:hypothetical protein
MLRPSKRRSATALLVALFAAQPAFLSQAYSKATFDVSVGNQDSAEDELSSLPSFSSTLRAVRSLPFRSAFGDCCLFLHS